MVFACNCDRCVCTNYRMIIDRGLDTIDVDVRKNNWKKFKGNGAEEGIQL